MRKDIKNTKLRTTNILPGCAIAEYLSFVTSGFNFGIPPFFHSITFVELKYFFDSQIFNLIKNNECCVMEIEVVRLLMVVLKDVSPSIPQSDPSP